MSNPLDTVTVTAFEWDEYAPSLNSEGFVALTAQELAGLYPTITTTATIPTGAVTINQTGAVGSTGIIGASGSSFTFNDPYAEIKERLNAIEKVILEEAEIRKTHPAVQTAYDHYRLLLVLAGKASPEDLDK
jgi:hypothetical protein